MSTALRVAERFFALVGFIGTVLFIASFFRPPPSWPRPPQEGGED